ncbi:MAG: S-adenosylmethionine:tRNA ribosyltransferase-isomerase [Bacteroidales bacterium]|jgi:S-adenosylmethionine:tRNA ribosyltransferase-isomerase
MSIREIRIEDYQYDLPNEKIALFPLANRDESNLLVYRNGEFSRSVFNRLPELLPDDSLLIWNNTKVIPARLQFLKSTGALIEIFLLEPVIPAVYTEMFSCTTSCTWKVIVGNQKKWKSGALIREIESATGVIRLSAEFEDSADSSTITLKWTPESFSFAEILNLFGKVPIPPYLKRDSTEQDKTSYQTVYADLDGSVAAPTAGLHFTPGLISRLKERNIRIDSLTLHVGSGTFIPVKSKTIGDHEMHHELVIIEKGLVQDLLKTHRENLTVIGTTSMRSLESLYWLGVKIHFNIEGDPGRLSVDQWQPYNTEQFISTRESLMAILNFLDKRGLDQIQFTTSLLIVPGYKFRLVNRLITNFHQPSSTLLLLVSALIGDKWRELYAYALENDFRFLSYGDSSLLEIQS